MWGKGDLFGGLFDFNGDGETDAMEAAIGFQMLEEAEREDSEEDEEEESDN